MIKNRDDFFDTVDPDREWIHTEVLSQRKKSRIISNITVVLVAIIAVCLVVIAFKTQFGKADRSNLENLNQVTQQQQAAIDQQKALDAAKQQLADQEAAKVKATADQTMVYAVKAGDTLASIAADFKVDMNAIVTANGITDPSKLEVGQQLKIPGVQKPADTTAPAGTNSAAGTTTNTAGEQTYTVKAGDQLGDIGAQFGISYQQIAQYNNITDPSKLEVGQVLKIPKKQ